MNTRNWTLEKYNPKKPSPWPHYERDHYEGQSHGKSTAALWGLWFVAGAALWAWGALMAWDFMSPHYKVWAIVTAAWYGKAVYWAFK